MLVGYRFLPGLFLPRSPSSGGYLRGPAPVAEGPRVEALRKFLGATYEGWGQAIQSPTDAARDL